MRLHKGSVAVVILETLWKYGQLPYTFLRLLPGDYEWKKDCLQKLVKAGYVGMIRDTNLKCLYLKPSGQEAYLSFCQRTELALSAEESPDIVYHVQKARRVERVREAQLLADLAGMVNYQSSNHIKRTMELALPRSSDSIKYSRFAGALFTIAGGLVVYHFGRKNVHLNANGESNANQAVRKRHREMGGRGVRLSFPMLILGSAPETALEILRYEDKLAAKSKGQRKHMKTRHFTLSEFRKIFGSILFLPIMESALEMLRIFARADSAELLSGIPRGKTEKGYQAVNLLDGRLDIWQSFLDREQHDPPPEFFCYDWQLPLVDEYFGLKDNPEYANWHIYTPADLLRWLEQADS